MIRIRTFEADDLAAVAGLMRDLGYPSPIERLRSRMDVIERMPDYFTFVAVYEERVAGMIGIRRLFSYEDDGCVTQISLLVTKKELEGRGIGSALVRYAEQWALEQGSHVLYLTSGMRPERQRAHAFYRSAGFEATGCRFVKKIGEGKGLEQRESDYI
ncbi:GNAT family N-acetyltransferase [Paenibacillus arenilitoris]|nr:GNAT family N-acetyltransferase [Paenibacillus arenilitoris]